MTFTVEAFSEGPFELGEGPHWHPQLKKLFFVDITAGFAATIDAAKKVQVLHQEDAGHTVSAVLPVEGQDSQIVVGVDTSVYLVDVATGEKKLLDKLATGGVRFNDAKCDPKGRLWIGTMGLETAPGVLTPEQGALYLLSKDGKLSEQLEKVSLSNGLAWSLDNKTLYYIDSFVRLIYAFDYDIETGKIANRRVLVNMNEDSDFLAAELPDGMTIDANGNLWVAMFNGKRIVSIDGKTGKVIDVIEMPTSMVTSVCFGGPNLDEMYVTSIKKFLDEKRKAEEPLAGYIFKVTSTKKDFKGHLPNFALQF